MKAIYVLPLMLASVMGGTTLLQPAHVALGPHAWAYSNLNLNLPAPVPAGEAPSPDLLVQRTAVQGIGRPVVTHTPQITEVHPQLRITEKTYNVPVPKPVYETKHVTPVHTQYVAEPYPVQQAVPVPQPYAVPTPVNVQVPVAQPVHVQHNVIAQPSVVAYSAPAVQQLAAVSAVQQVPTLSAIQKVAGIPAFQHVPALTSIHQAGVIGTGAITPVTYNAVQGIAATPIVTQSIHKIEIDDDDK